MSWKDKLPKLGQVGMIPSFGTRSRNCSWKNTIRRSVEAQQLVVDYNNASRSVKESVWEYSQRFKKLVREAQRDPTDELVKSKFVNTVCICKDLERSKTK